MKRCWNLDITGIPTGTIIEVDVRNYTNPIEIIITDTSTCCSDTILLRKCGLEQPCVEDIIVESQFNQVITCGEKADICIAVPYNSINNYEVIANDIPFTGNITPCDFDSMFAYTYFTLPNQGAVGPYRINLWMIDGQMHSGMFNDIVGLVQLMNQIDPEGDWKLDESTVTIQGGNSNIDYGAMIIEQTNTGSSATLEINSNHIPMGTQLAFTEGNYEVLLVSNASGCRDRFLVNIACQPADSTDIPVDTTDVPVDTTDMPVDTTDVPIDTTDVPVDTTDVPVDTTEVPTDYDGGYLY